MNITVTHMYFFQYLKSAKVPPSLDSKIWQKFKAINCAQVIKKKTAEQNKEVL